MRRSTPLVLALHGTRSVAGQQVARDLVLAVAARLPGVDVQLGWADVLTPTLTETLTVVGDAVVVPGFLTAGFHVASDLPAAIQASGGRARLAGLIGPALIEAVADRLLAAGGPGDAIVLAAAGSLRPRSVAEVTSAARQLAAIVGRPVVAAFLTAAQPSVMEAVAQLRASGHHRISIASYLLAPGVFSERLHACGADRVSDPIGVHPLVVEAVASAYAAAVDERRDVPGQAPGVGRERIA